MKHPIYFTWTILVMIVVAMMGWNIGAKLMTQADDVLNLFGLVTFAMTISIEYVIFQITKKCI